MDGFGIHCRLRLPRRPARPVFLVIGVVAGIGKWRLGRHGVLALLLILQVLLAWFGFEVPAIGFFHPVNALLIFIMLLWIVNDTWRGGRTPRRIRARRHPRRGGLASSVELAEGERRPSLPFRSLRVVVRRAAGLERRRHAHVGEVHRQPRRGVAQVVAVIHPDAGVVGAEGDLVPLARLDVERVAPPGAAATRACRRG